MTTNNSIRRRPFVLAPVALLGLLVIAVVCSPSRASAASPGASATPAAPPGTVALGQVLDVTDWSFAVVGWEAKPFPKDLAPDDDADTMGVIVDVVIDNKGSKVLGVSGNLEATLQDETGREFNGATGLFYHNEGTYEEVHYYTNGEELIRIRAAPGERVRGKLAFKVPKGAGNLVLVADATLSSTPSFNTEGRGLEVVKQVGRAHVWLGREPVKVSAPPPPVSQKVASTVALNQPVSFGDFSVTVNGVRAIAPNEVRFLESGTMCLAVDMTLRNQGSDPRNWIHKVNLHLRDRERNLYRACELPREIAGATEGDIQPGPAVQGTLAFQVPEGTQSVYLTMMPAPGVDSDSVTLELSAPPPAAPEPTDTPAPFLTPTPAPTFDPAGISAEVTGWSLMSKHPQRAIGDDQQLVVVDVSVTNSGNQTLLIPPGGPAIVLQDSSGEQYSYTPVFTHIDAGNNPNPFPFTEIKPGTAAQQKLYFEVPKSSRGYSLILRMSQVLAGEQLGIGGEDIRIPLGDKPTG